MLLHRLQVRLILSGQVKGRYRGVPRKRGGAGSSNGSGDSVPPAASQTRVLWNPRCEGGGEGRAQEAGSVTRQDCS
jgi:hypothetical protein